MPVHIDLIFRPQPAADLDTLRAAVAPWPVIDGPAVRVTKAHWRTPAQLRKELFATACQLAEVTQAHGCPVERVEWFADDGVRAPWTTYDGEPCPWVVPPEPTPRAFDLPPGPPRFPGLYGLEDQTLLIETAVRQAAATKFAVRPHVLLHGPPGCGKTELLLAFAKWLGPGRAWHLDTATLSKAGLERELLSRARSGRLPPWLVLEEIEKTEKKNLTCLLAVMDTRGTVSRLNGRDGEVAAKCRPHVLATCNDMKKLRKWHDGALADRFAGFTIQLPRPDRETTVKILAGKCGREDWARVVTDYLFDELKDTSIRRGIDLLAGGDRLPEVLAAYRRVAR
jgi:hypothetical protein